MRNAAFSTEILKAEQVTQRFSSCGTGTFALKNVSFSVQDGSFVSVIGRSGSGKTTLLHTLGGLSAPQAGHVYLQGTDVYSLKEKNLCALRRKKIGFVFQSFHLVPELTVYENICLPSYLDNAQPDQRFIYQIMDMLGLKNKEAKYPHELSGGEQQRTAMARSLSTRPAVILADEPTGHLDMRSGEELLDLLRRCHRQFSQTIILATHDLNIARRSQRIITLENGQIISDYHGDRI